MLLGVVPFEVALPEALAASEARCPNLFFLCGFGALPGFCTFGTASSPPFKRSTMMPLQPGEERLPRRNCGYHSASYSRVMLRAIGNYVRFLWSACWDPVWVIRKRPVNDKNSQKRHDHPKKKQQCAAMRSRPPSKKAQDAPTNGCAYAYLDSLWRLRMSIKLHPAHATPASAHAECLRAFIQWIQAKEHQLPMYPVLSCEMSSKLGRPAFHGRYTWPLATQEHASSSSSKGA